MKLLLTHRYFWPDTTPYAVMLRSMARDLSIAGHDVHIYASRPSYRGGVSAPAHEMLEQIHVNRTWVLRENRANPLNRATNVVLYCFGLFAHILRTRPDLVIASTFPPIFAGWSASFAARLVGAKFIYHVQDIHPEVSKYGGGLLGRGLVSRFLTWLDNHTLRRASAIVVLSEDMADTLRTRGQAKLPIRVIGNFLLDTFGESTSPPTQWHKCSGRRRVIFAGNLGRFQNLPLLAEGIAHCFTGHPELELMFLGDGMALPELKARWGGNAQVRFAPFMPFAQARGLIAESDIGLVSLSADMYRVAYPSKLLTYLGLGIPVLALVEPASNLANTIRTYGLGTVPDDFSATAVGEALERLLANGASRTKILDWYERNTSAAICLQHWRHLISSFC